MADIEMRSSSHDSGETKSSSATELLLKKKNDFGLNLLQTLTKQHVKKLNPRFVTIFLLVFIGVSIGVFIFFLYYFLNLVCSPATTSIQPFWSDSVYTEAFMNPSGGLYPCQTFFQASYQECAHLSSATRPPSKAPTTGPPNSVPTVAPSPKPTTVAQEIQASQASQYCLIPCTLPNVNCDKDYGTFNPSVCNSAVAPELGTYYGNYSYFQCSVASTISCITQIGPGGITFNKVPAAITVVYLQCTPAAQSLLNAIQYTTYCQMVMAVLLALILIVKKKGFRALLSVESWTEALAAVEKDDDKDDDKKNDERETIGLDGSSLEEKKK